MNAIDKPAGLTIYEQRDGPRLILTLEGSLNINSSKHLERYVQRIDYRVQELHLDLRHLRYISSDGLRTIMLMLKTMRAKGGRLIIPAISEAVRDVFNLTGMIDVFLRDERLVILETERSPDRIVYTATGNMGVNTLSKIQSLLLDLENSGAREVIIDCTKVTSVAPMVAQSLKYEVGRLASKGTQINLVNLQEQPAVVKKAEEPRLNEWT